MSVTAEDKNVRNGQTYTCIHRKSVLRFLRTHVFLGRTNDDVSECRKINSCDVIPREFGDYCGEITELARDDIMEKKNKYYVVRDKALPEVLQKVVEVKRLLETDKNLTVQEAAEQVGLSRSSFYKYKDDILPFSDNTRGKTVTLVIQMMDEPGLLSDLLHIVADYRANILTIHQTIPVNGSATVTLSVEVLSDTGNVAGMVEEIEHLKGVQNVKILGVEK